MNKSPMICVFRVGGLNLDIDAFLSGAAIQPFRIDRAGVGKAKINALHYDVSCFEPVTSSELASSIEAFLAKNARDILFMRQMSSVEHFVLDVSLTIDADMATRTMELSQPLLIAMAEAGLSFAVSTYRNTPDSN